jgi:hypothetical protein
VAWSAADTARFRERAAGLRTSTFMLVAAAVAVSLSEYESGDDVAFLCPTPAARGRPGTWWRMWPSWDLVAYVADRSMVRLDVCPRIWSNAWPSARSPEGFRGDASQRPDRMNII